MDLVALRVELDAGHPVTGAYDADSQVAANEINALNIVRIREQVRGPAIKTISSEYTTKTPAQKNQWIALLTIEAVDPNDDQLALAVIDEIFGDSSATHAAFIADRDETVSQATAEELGGVRANDIIGARALP